MRLIQPFDPWRSSLCTCPPKYSLNPYTGCQYGCRYCYITSYIPRGFNPRPKKDFLRRLEKEVASLEDSLPVAISFSTDPYQPLEKIYGYTRQTLKILREYGVPVLITTKSNLVERDIDILTEMDTAVSITITTHREEIARAVEPGAPSPRERLETVSRLSDAGIPIAVRIDPIIPGVTDRAEDLEELVRSVSEKGARHIVSSVYKAKPDNLGRMIKSIPRFQEVYRDLYRGPRINGYRYASTAYREGILRMVRSLAHRYGMTFITCREGLEHLDDKDVYCDASHLLRRR